MAAVRRRRSGAAEYRNDEFRRWRNALDPSASAAATVAESLAVVPNGLDHPGGGRELPRVLRRSRAPRAADDPRGSPGIRAKRENRAKATLAALPSAFIGLASRRQPTVPGIGTAIALVSTLPEIRRLLDEKAIFASRAGAPIRLSDPQSVARRETTNGERHPRRLLLFGR